MEDDYKEVTAAVLALTTLEGDISDSDNKDQLEDFAAENEPQPLPTEIIYNRQGKHALPARAIIVPSIRETRGRKQKQETGAKLFIYKQSICSKRIN